jgi:hypothetical protein
MRRRLYAASAAGAGAPVSEPELTAGELRSILREGEEMKEFDDYFVVVKGDARFEIKASPRSVRMFDHPWTTITSLQELRAFMDDGLSSFVSAVISSVGMLRERFSQYDPKLVADGITFVSEDNTFIVKYLPGSSKLSVTRAKRVDVDDISSAIREVERAPETYDGVINVIFGGPFQAGTPHKEYLPPSVFEALIGAIPSELNEPMTFQEYWRRVHSIYGMKAIEGFIKYYRALPVDLGVDIDRVHARVMRDDLETCAESRMYALVKGDRSLDASVSDGLITTVTFPWFYTQRAIVHTVLLRYGSGARPVRYVGSAATPEG